MAAKKTAPVGQWSKWFPIHAEKPFHPGTNVTAVWANSDHLDLFATDGDGRVWSTWWESGPGWQSWFAIHPEQQFSPGAPVTALWATADHLDLFITDAHGHVWSTWWEQDPGYQEWFVIHPDVTLRPGATVTALWANSDHLDLFVTGGDGRVWSTWWESDPGYQPWFAIRPETQQAFSLTVTAVWANASHLDLFITNQSGAVWSTWWESDPGWQPWFPIRPESTFAAGATVSALWANADHLDLFITGADGAVFSTWWEFDPGWQPWFAIDREVTFKDGATVTPVWANSDHLDLFVTGRDGAVASNWWDRDGDWARWFDIHPEVTFHPGAPVTARWANDSHLDLFVTAADGVVWSTFYDDTASPDWALLASEGFEGQSMKATYFFAGEWRCCTGWEDWFPVRPEIKKFDEQASATAVWANEVHLDLFATDAAGVVWSTWSEIGGNGWQPWFPIHAEKVFHPGAPVTAVWASSSHLDLFATDEDRFVWTTWWEADAGWQPWFAIQPNQDFQRGGAVTALWANDEHLDLFISDSDGAVWTTWWESDAGWQPWFTINPSVDHVFKPGIRVAAAWASADHLDLFMTDLEGAVWSTWWESDPGWQPWFMIHPEIRFERGALVTALWANDAHLDLFVTAHDGTVWSSWWESDPGWQPWFAIHDEVKFNPGAPVSAQWSTASHLDLFLTDSNGLAWSTWWESDPGWQPWFIIHPEPKFRPGAPVAVTRSKGLFTAGRIDLYVPAADGTIWGTFYPGNPKSKWYEYPMTPNESTYTRHPSDARDLGWSENAGNRTFVIDKMLEGGVNVITMSDWGERGSDRWAFWAPMHTSTMAHDELFDATIGRNILIMPAIESGDATIACGGISPAYQFASDFPDVNGIPAPQLVIQIEDLIHRYLKAPANPAWPAKWAQMYDRQGDKRYVVNILHVASNRIGSDEDARFAAGFDRVAAQVFADTGVMIGFTLDLLPSPVDVNNGGCGKDDFVTNTFTPSAGNTGPWLREQASFLAVQAFIPEVYLGSSNDGALLQFKEDYLQSWIDARLPVMLDVDPGYDAHVVFPRSENWGLDRDWRDALSSLRRLDVKGIVFNCWNGYTEGYAAVPTLEDGDVVFQWMQDLFN